MPCNAAKGIETPVTTFSLSSPAADFYATNLHFAHGCGRCDVLHNGEHYAALSLSVPGRHNVGKRACGHCRCCVVRLRRRTNHPRVIYVYRGASTHGIQGDICTNGAAVYDDFAHHPSEIKTTLAGAKQMGYQRVFVVFQPHTYSRTAALSMIFALLFLQPTGDFYRYLRGT